MEEIKIKLNTEDKDVILKDIPIREIVDYYSIETLMDVAPRYEITDYVLNDCDILDTVWDIWKEDILKEQDNETQPLSFKEKIEEFLKNETILKGCVDKEDVKKQVCEFIDNNFDKTLHI
jgi:hypothetical protein